MNTIATRAAGPADAGPIARVHVKTWKIAYRGIMPDAFLDGIEIGPRLSMWTERLGPDADPAARRGDLVAESGGELVGFASYGPCRDEDLDPVTTGEIYAIYVDPDRWRSGAGSALLDRALAALAARGLGSTTLWVLAANERARSFYARHGFAPDGSEKLHELKATPPITLDKIRLARAGT